MMCEADLGRSLHRHRTISYRLTRLYITTMLITWAARQWRMRYLIWICTHAVHWH